LSIEDRNLKAGTKLVATYKKQEFSCEVVKTKDGVIYRLADGQEFKSLSSAGSAVMGGSACNGWRFWSLEGDLPQAKVTAAAKPPKAEQTIKPMKGDPTRFWCSACMDSFPVTEGETPEACPQGHTNASVETPAPKAAKKTAKAPAKRKAAAKAKA
jgi:Restriction Enzyme Adenine Methylase Associated